MRSIKAFLAGVTGLFIIITIFSLLIPSRVQISRGVMIDASGMAVYQQIALFENWKKWHPIFTVGGAGLYPDAPGIAGTNQKCRIVHHGKEIIIQLVSADSNSVKFFYSRKVPITLIMI
ncbi:MAG: hypothetical protein WKI04_03250 [Ferruginibacter sp.]